MSIPQALGVLAAWTVLSAIVGAIVGNAIDTPDDAETDEPEAWTPVSWR